MPKGYGGYEKDNTLAYATEELTAEQLAARKQERFEEKLQAGATAGAIRREKLTDLLESQQEKVKEEARKVTEDDLEFIQGEEEYERLEREKCCAKQYVDPVLLEGKAQARFIIKALFPLFLTYGITAAYGICMVIIYPFRVYFYRTAPTYALISTGCWVGLNVFGRMVRTRTFLIPIYSMRSLATINMLPALQLYSEYHLWEVLFVDTTVTDLEATMQMEARLRKDNHFQESWLNLPTDTHVNDFDRRTHFTHAYFGALFAFSCFCSLLGVIVGLVRRSYQEDITPREVTGSWMQRTAGLAGLLPSFLLFFLNQGFQFLAPPKSTNFLQVFPTGILAMAHGVMVTAMWARLFAGRSCFDVLSEDALYFGFMFSL